MVTVLFGVGISATCIDFPSRFPGVAFAESQPQEAQPSNLAGGACPISVVPFLVCSIDLLGGDCSGILSKTP